MTSQQQEEVECLIKNQLYYQDTGRCYDPLEQGPCRQGQWLVLGSPFAGSVYNCLINKCYKSYSGAGFCEEKLTCNHGDQAYLNPKGGAYCDCEEGREKSNGRCEPLFTRGSCKEGEVLVLKQQKCPAQFSCRGIDNCPAYQETKRYLKNNKSKRMKVIEFLKLLVCETDSSSRAICCPEYDDNSILSPVTIIRALADNSEVLCMKNSCPEGSWPWAEYDEKIVCREADSSVKT